MYHRQFPLWLYLNAKPLKILAFSISQFQAGQQENRQFFTLNRAGRSCEKAGLNRPDLQACIGNAQQKHHAALFSKKMQQRFLQRDLPNGVGMAADIAFIRDIMAFGPQVGCNHRGSF